jgi:hypothetical protein
VGCPATEQQSGVSVGVAVVSKVLAAKFTQHHRHGRQRGTLQEATAGVGKAHHVDMSHLLTCCFGCWATSWPDAMTRNLHFDTMTCKLWVQPCNAWHAGVAWQLAYQLMWTAAFSVPHRADA